MSHHALNVTYRAFHVVYPFVIDKAWNAKYADLQTYYRAPNIYRPINDAADSMTSNVNRVERNFDKSVKSCYLH